LRRGSLGEAVAEIEDEFEFEDDLKFEELKKRTRFFEGEKI
jgi:hypothetical protein